MKNIFKKISIILMLLILSMSAIYLAANETDSEPSVNYDDQVVPISMDNDEPIETSLPEGEQTLFKNYFYAGTDDINITTPVLGDVFVATSGTVTIDTSISGNAFICARTVLITEKATIQSSLFNASNSISITGAIGNNIYNVSEEFNLNGTIENDLFVTSSKCSIDGYVYGAANIASENVTVSDNSYFENDLNYSSKEQANISENVVKGKINHTVSDSDDDDNSFNVKDIIFSIIAFIVLALVIFVICEWLNCKYINTYPDFVKNLPKSLLYGFLGLIVTPILSIILLILSVTVSLSFILMAIYIISLIIASSIVIVVLSRLAAEKLHSKFKKVNDTLLTILSIVVLSIAYKLLQLIPTLGTIITFAFVMVGIGILIKNLIPSKEHRNS